MRRILIPMAAIAVLAFAGCGSDDSSSSKSSSSTSTSTPATAVVQDATVKISNFKFAPIAVAVKAGGTVTWTNDDSAQHTATDNKGKAAFDTGTLDQGKSKKITFSTPGTYAYICDFHPFMKGTVVAQ